MTTPTLRALRGAITCGVDSPQAVGEATIELLGAMMERNAVAHDDVVSVVFTTTPDLVSSFPATAAREIGFGDIPLLCASEIAVPGSMPRCVRVLMHLYTARPRDQLHHVYLRNAVSLRDDLPG
jgi:chorismate mutase